VPTDFSLAMNSLTSLVLSSGLVLLVFAFIDKAFNTSHPLDAIPIVGSSGLRSYWEAFKLLLTGGPALIRRGYDLYPEGCFRIARPTHWLVVVSGPKHVKEFGDAQEHVLSFRGGMENTIAGSSLAWSTYLPPTKNLAKSPICLQ
jgi:hypothetical protein